MVNNPDVQLTVEDLDNVYKLMHTLSYVNTQTTSPYEAASYPPSNHALVLLLKLTCQLFAPCYVLRTDEINHDL
jgi:hypothetical protein